jgi:hypothetical protein
MKHACSSQRKTKGTRRSCYSVVLGFKREIRHRHAHKHITITMTYLICWYYRILFLEPCWSCWCWWCTRRECGASPLKPVNAIEATKGGIQRDSMIQNYGQGHSGSMRSLWMPPLVAVETWKLLRRSLSLSLSPSILVSWRKVVWGKPWAFNIKESKCSNND